MRSLLRQFLRDDQGQGLVEYGLILVLVAVLTIVALESIGVSTIGFFSSTGNHLSNIQGS